MAMESCIPLPIEKNVINDVVEKAIDWALLHGAVMRKKRDHQSVIAFVPFTLLPSICKKDNFNKVLNLQTSVNELIHKVAHNHEFLESALKNSVIADVFTRRLYDIYETVRKEGFSQSVSFGILRTDYLPDHDAQMKQVEINTVASSFGSLSTILFDLHRFVLSELGYQDKLKNLPNNNALGSIANGLIFGWQQFGNPNSAIMFLVEEKTFNIADQRFIEYEIKKNEKCPVIIRRTLTYVQEHGALSDSKELIIDGTVVGLVYMRSGYDPCQYPTEAEWDARLLIERSTAIKCPDIRLHLAGSKKVQQKLAEPGVLEKFITNKDVADTFTHIYSLDQGEEDEALKLGKENPTKYVLKPQREGGGNNVFGEGVRKLLEEMSPRERGGWILMERIIPPVRRNVLVSHEGASMASVISELGIFGIVIGDSKNIFMNRNAGHMMRTKHREVDEGGVAAGFAVLDSPYLV